MTCDRYFSSSYYLKKYPDVANNWRGTAFSHFVQYGQHENREPSQNYDPIFYLDKYSDVAAAVNRGETTAYNHFCWFGDREMRQPTASFCPSYYKKIYSVPDSIPVTFHHVLHPENTQLCPIGTAPTSTGTTACDFSGATLINVTINGCNIQISRNSRIDQLSNGQKVDVNLYDCIDKALDASCSLISGKVGKASCALDLLNKNTGNAAELIIEQIPIINKIDDVADFFVGDAIDTICSGAQSIVFSGAALAFATLLLVFE